LFALSFTTNFKLYFAKLTVVMSVLLQRIAELVVLSVKMIHISSILRILTFAQLVLLELLSVIQLDWLSIGKRRRLTFYCVILKLMSTLFFSCNLVYLDILLLQDQLVNLVLKDSRHLVDLSLLLQLVKLVPLELLLLLI